MNFQELCERTAEEVNGRPLTFSSVSLAVELDPFKRQVIRAVSKSYMDMLLYSRHWTFLNRRGVLLELTDGQREYRLSGIQTLDWDSLYLTQLGNMARFPVWEMDYQEWQLKEQQDPGTEGVPLRLVKSDVPDVWIFWPTPNADYTLNGNLQYKPEALSGLTDEPLWDEQYHELLVWLAVRWLEGRVKTLDEKVGALNASEAQRASETQFRAFCRQYLPSVRDHTAFG